MTLSDRYGPPLDLLLPVESPFGAGGSGRRVPPEPGEPRLRALYRYPDLDAGRAWVRANMIATLDGAATGADGRSGSINGPADHRVFAVLRSLADVVLVGAGTVRAEGYRELPVRADLAGPRAARGQSSRPELAVVSRSGALPDELLDSEDPPLVVTVADLPGLGALRARLGPDRVVVAGTGDVDPVACVAALAGRGLQRVLAEGGARVLGDLLAADVVDDLCLTTTSDLVGGPARRVVDRETWLRPPRRARLAHLLHGDDVLLGRWRLGTGA